MTFYRLDPPTVRNVDLPAIRQEMYTPPTISGQVLFLVGPFLFIDCALVSGVFSVCPSITIVTSNNGKHQKPMQCLISL